MDVFPINEKPRSDEISPSVYDSLPEAEWPSIAATEHVDTTLELDIEMRDESESPMIDFESKEKVVDLHVVEDPAISALSMNDEFGERKSNKITDSIVFEMPAQSQQSNSEISNMSDFPEESITEQKEEFLIPDLDIVQESIQSQQFNDQVRRSDDSGSAEILQDLGELRFAQDD